MNAQDTNKDAIESGKLGRSLAILFIVLLLLTTGLYWSAYMWGRGGRGYFSPDTLESKSQSEWLIPLTEIPIYRSSYEYHTFDLVQFLLDEGYWTVITKENPNWIFSFHWNGQWRDGGSMLHQQLSWHGDEWIAWTKANPQLAKVVWPRILILLRGDEDDQWIASTLLQCARSAFDVDDLRLMLKAENIELELK